VADAARAALARVLAGAAEVDAAHAVGAAEVRTAVLLVAALDARGAAARALLAQEPAVARRAAAARGVVGAATRGRAEVELGRVDGPRVGDVRDASF
jgi:hypothetical protein